MEKIGGELLIEVNKVVLNEEKDMKAPYGKSSMIDFSILDKDGCWLHICGKNDWGYLLVDALMPLINYADGVLATIRKMLDDYNGHPEVIMLGRNEYRAVDIVHRLRGKGEPISIFLNIPVIKSKQSDYIKLLGNEPETMLPF